MRYSTTSIYSGWTSFDSEGRRHRPTWALCFHLLIWSVFVFADNATSPLQAVIQPRHFAKAFVKLAATFTFWKGQFAGCTRSPRHGIRLFLTLPDRRMLCRIRFHRLTRAWTRHGHGIWINPARHETPVRSFAGSKIVALCDYWGVYFTLIRGIITWLADDKI